VSRSAFSPPPATTLVDLARFRARETPDLRLYTFLLDGEVDEAHLTAAELDRAACAIAARLTALGARGERALLLYAPGLEYIAAFFGCLYAGVTAVPAYPPDPFRLDRTLPRLRAIAADARAKVALTTCSIAALAGPLCDDAPELASLQWVETDAVPAALAAEWEAPPLGPESLAFLQYTSGSTSAPRGVALMHANLRHNAALIEARLGYGLETKALFWLPPYHDMGLIGGILQALHGGFPEVLMSPLAISRHRATLSGGPNFAFDLCVRKTTPEQRAALDLRSWDIAFNGAEPIRAETLDRFADAFAVAGFRREALYPCYGLAEATLLVTGAEKDAPPVVRAVDPVALESNHVAPATSPQSARMLVGCGRTGLGQSVRIVDPATHEPLGDDRVGEIWVSGASVARGYFGREEDTRRIFEARLSTGEGSFLRTGDLGFVSGGELFVTGRLKDLIIVDGRNHYPQDIELTVERCHPAVRPGCAAAFASDARDAERVVVVAEVHRGAPPRAGLADPGGVVEAIRAAVAKEHDLRVHAIVLLEAGTIPKTSSGKIQRHACKQGFLAGTLEVVG
jgi:acyl-CoA synthetase (AMP-forming)/AMP-acid ligase II